MNFFDGIYYLDWITLKDTETPLKDTKVIITKNRSKINKIF